MSGEWVIRPLGGKYYGTRIDLGGVTDVTVWVDDFSEGVSEREIAQGWDEDEPYYDHIESAVGFKIARLIEAAPRLLRRIHDLQHPQSFGDCEQCDLLLQESTFAP